MIIIKWGCSSSLFSLKIFSAFSFNWFLLRLVSNFDSIWSTIHFLFLLLVTPSNLVHVHTRSTSEANIDFTWGELSILVTAGHSIDCDRILTHYALASIIWATDVDIIDLSYSKVIRHESAVFLFIFASNSIRETIIIWITSRVALWIILLLLSLSCINSYYHKGFTYCYFHWEEFDEYWHWNFQNSLFGFERLKSFTDYLSEAV